MVGFYILSTVANHWRTLVGSICLFRLAPESKMSGSRTIEVEVATVVGPTSSWPRFAATPVLLGALALPTSALAVDGCLVLLCLAAPSWSAIPQCVDPVRQLFRDLARGKPFPSCAMSGGGNTARQEWASPTDFCPPQYTVTIEQDSRPIQYCTYMGAVSVISNGALWTRTWWTLGDTVTEYTDAAKASLGTWNTRFDDDLASWLAARPSVPCAAC